MKPLSLITRQDRDYILSGNYQLLDAVIASHAAQSATIEGLRAALQRVTDLAPEIDGSNDTALVVGVISMRDEARAALNGQTVSPPSCPAEVLHELETAIKRVELANEEGNPILSAWLPDARAILFKYQA